MQDPDKAAGGRFMPSFIALVLIGAVFHQVAMPVRPGPPDYRISYELGAGAAIAIAGWVGFLLARSHTRHPILTGWIVAAAFTFFTWLGSGTHHS